jgi:capsid protein
MGMTCEEDEIIARGGKPAEIARKRSAELQAKRDGGIPIVLSSNVHEIGTRDVASDQENVGTPAPGADELKGADEQRLEQQTV